MASQSEIIDRQKKKMELWCLSEQQRAMGDEPVEEAAPDEFVCPICYEEMIPPDRRPMTLFPCGHSICAECLKKYKEMTHTVLKCPMCNERMQSSAVNYALLSAIENRGTPKPQDGMDFGGELRLTKERLVLLLDQLQEKEARLNVVKRELDTEQKVMDVLDEELKFVMEQHSAQRTKVDALASEKESLSEESVRLKVVIDPLLVEVQKLELLVQGTSGQ